MTLTQSTRAAPSQQYHHQSSTMAASGYPLSDLDHSMSTNYIQLAACFQLDNSKCLAVVQHLAKTFKRYQIATPRRQGISSKTKWDGSAWRSAQQLHNLRFHSRPVRPAMISKTNFGNFRALFSSTRAELPSALLAALNLFSWSRINSRNSMETTMICPSHAFRPIDLSAPLSLLPRRKPQKASLLSWHAWPLLLTAASSWSLTSTTALPMELLWRTCFARFRKPPEASLRRFTLAQTLVL
jgi:hypothetical protein